MEVIKTEKLTKYYGKTAGILDLDLEIRKGEIFGFLGPNGAGKSTTIRLLLNLLRPTAGHVRLFGADVRRSYHQIFNRIGNVPGELQFYEDLSGKYILDYMARFSSKPSVLQSELTAAFSLAESDLQKKVKYYSHGMKQKLAIIQAMQEDPDLLIMDEPSEGVDPINRKVLYDFVKRFKQKGKTVFFSSHNLAEVDKICDRVGLVRNGRLIALESIANLKKKMVRRMEIQFHREIDQALFNIRDVTIIEKDPQRMVLNVAGDINPILTVLATLPVADLVFPEPSLEETFMTYYQDKDLS